MRKILLNISSISLAFLVLFSTFSFTVEKHYCGDFLIDVSYFGHAKGCGMETNTPLKTIKKSCCKDEVQKIEGQDELQKSSVTSLEFKKHNYLISVINTPKEVFEITGSRKLFYKDFSPPDIPIDYQVFYQSFLI
jgi:hypothetical protein